MQSDAFPYIYFFFASMSTSPFLLSVNIFSFISASIVFSSLPYLLSGFEGSNISLDVVSVT